MSFDFKVADLGTQWQAALPCDGVHLVHRLDVAIHGQRRESSLRKPQRVPPASAGNVERPAIVRQQAGMLYEPRCR